MTSVLIRDMQDRHREMWGGQGLPDVEDRGRDGGLWKLGERPLPTASGQGWRGIAVALPEIWLPAGQAWKILRIKYIMKAIH